jgi:hypothetical protein
MSYVYMLLAAAAPIALNAGVLMVIAARTAAD